MLRYPQNGRITSTTENHTQIDLPGIEGTNLISKYLTIDVVDGENCSPLTDEWFPDMVGKVQKRRVKINDLLFLREEDWEGAMGKSRERVCYSISRLNICVSITMNIVFVVHDNFYPSIIPRVDLDAEKMIGSLVANTFKWIDA